MGNFLRRLFSKKTQVHALEKDPAEERDEEHNLQDDEYEEDVQDAANLAISMQQGDDTTNYELTISCEGLPKMDFLSLTDPMVVVYTEQENGTYREVGKTEVIQNDLDPVFVKNFILPYSKTKSSQKIKFEVYDIDNEAEKDHLEKQEYIGMVEIPFEEFVISQSETLKRDIIVVSKGTKKKQKNLGKLCVKAFESDIGQSKIWFVFGVEDFVTRNFISMYIKGSSNNKEYFVIHNTPKMKNTSDGCVFPKFSVNSNKIGDESSNLKFEFYEIKKNEPKLLGDVEISLVGLHNNSNKRLNIYRNNLVIGKLKIIDLIREKKNTFLNYIYDGYCLKLIVATDLTLKYAEDRTQGAVTTIANYTTALRQTTELLKFYDDDERTVSIGFGVKMPPYFNVVSHNFAINGNYFNPCVKSIDQLCESLEKAAQDVRMHGPVIISEILRYAGEVATYLKRAHTKEYVVLMILIDGDVTDVEASCSLLKEFSDLPLSVLAVGIGKKKFPKLKLIKKRHREDQHQDPASKKRSLFHYIKFNSVSDNISQLSLNVFAEIPKQFLEYMKRMNLEPKKVKDSKEKNSKNEIKKKLEARKKKNSAKVHTIVEFLSEQKSKFLNEVKPLGYNQNMVEEIMMNGLQAKEFNLVSEIVAKLEREIQEKEMQPMQIRKLDADYSELLPSLVKSNLIDEEEMKVRPDRKDLYIRDKVPEKKSKEWQPPKLQRINLKNETHTATQKLLLNIEEDETAYWEDNLPDLLNKQFRNKRELTKHREEPEVMQKIDKSDKLEPYLEHEKQKYDNRYGTKTTKNKICLLCNQREISIIFMNCGHAVACSQCKTLVNDVCLICGSKINYYINAVPKKEKAVEEFSRHLSSIDEEDYVKQSNLLEIESCDKSFEQKLDNKGELGSKRRASERDNSDGDNRMIELSKKSNNFSKPALQKNSEKLLSEKKGWKSPWGEKEEERKISSRASAKMVAKRESEDSSSSEIQRQSSQAINSQKTPPNITQAKQIELHSRAGHEAEHSGLDSEEEGSGSRYGSQSFQGKEMTEKALLTEEDAEMGSEGRGEAREEDSENDVEIRDEGLRKGARFRSRGYLNPVASKGEALRLNRRSEF